MTRRISTYERDLKERMYIHIGECADCNTALAHRKGAACETGARLSYEWLEHRHKQGDKSATYILDQLKETGIRRL